MSIEVFAGQAKASCGYNPGVFSLRTWLTKAVLRLLYSPCVYTRTIPV
jgi:hypothetical protein